MFKTNSAMVTDMDTAFDAVPVDSVDGAILWATVKIEYILSGLTPVVTIRIPIPYLPEETEDRRRSQALRCARQLIDHACQAAGSKPEGEIPAPATWVESIMPALEGVAQELGLEELTSRPKRRAKV